MTPQPEAKNLEKTRYPWVALGLGLFSQVASTVFLATPAFLIPLLHQDRGLSLSHAGLIAGAPNLGIVLSLIAWGAFTDRYGERLAMSAGLASTALVSILAMSVHGYLALGLVLLLGGMVSGSTSSASGKVVMGWFPVHRRGLAMGIRQMSQPLGVTVAALTVPTLARHGIPAALSVALGFNALLAVACVIGVRNPPRKARPASSSPINPYQTGRFLWRIHATSLLLVVPQFTISTFGLVWLVSRLHFNAVAAGVIVALSQFAGAIGRIGVGVLSDRVHSRVRPLRWVALSAVTVMVLMSVADLIDSQFTAVALILAAVVTVADNGLAFTAVAEYAGTSWSGRALGVQNTGQFLAAAAVAPVVGALIGTTGYSWAYLAVALCPVVAFPLIPLEIHYPPPP
jgi:sugar phosphate permease